MEWRPGERIDDLGRKGLRIIQHPGRFPFSMDPILLAHFVTVRKGERVVDLGTGTGVVPLLLSALHPNCHLTGIEIQPETANMAERSVRLNRLEERITIRCADYRDEPRALGYGWFDVATINPPYREPGRGKVSTDEARATSRHEIHGRLTETLAAAAQLVRFGGKVAVVFLAERMTDLQAGMGAHRLEPKRLRCVHSSLDRPAELVLVEARKGGGAGVLIEPPLVVYDKQGKFTVEMEEMYGVSTFRAD